MKKFILMLVLIIALIIVGTLAYYNSSLKAVNGNGEDVVFTIEEGITYSTLADKLFDEGFIKNELTFKIYVKLNSPDNLFAGDYVINDNMDVSELINALTGEANAPESMFVTFSEGLNMRQIATIISDNTSNSYEDLFTLIENETYIDSLITNYWFLTDEIKNEKIYYSLEGYLFPDTYSIETERDVPVEEVLTMLLDQTDIILSKYKEDIEASEFTIHEMLTIASIVELEGLSDDDRADIAGVFYNRLEDNITLGSDVTTYYAEMLEIGERDLYQTELDAANSYNTRSVTMAGILPVSPICNPGEASIAAAINPGVHNYYFFVADKIGKAYFTSTYNEHLNIIEELKAQGLWYTWD